MHNIWRVFVRDVSRICAVPFAVALLVASCVIPGLYSWLNVAANFDPYSLTGNVPIAVANNDRGTSVNDQTMNIGDQTVESLKKNHDLGWRFVDEHEAIAGVESSKYYAAIVIPKDFSANFTSALSGKVVRPQLDFYVNEKVNSLSPRVTQSGANSVEQQINETFVSTVSGAVTRELSAAAGKADTVMQGEAGQLTSQLDKVQNTIAQSRNKLTKANSSIASARQTIAQTKTGLTALAAQSDTLSSGINGTAGSISTVRGGLADFQQSADKTISQGQSDFGTLSGRINGLVGTVNGNAEHAAGRVDATLASLASANDALLDAIEVLQSDPELADSTVLAQAKEHQTHIAEQIAALQQINDALPGATSAAGDKVTGALNNIQAKLDGMTGVVNSASAKANSGLDAASVQLVGLAGTASGAAQELRQANSGLDQLDATLSQSSQTIAQTRTALNNVSDSISRTQADFALLQSSEAWQAITGAAHLDADNIADFLASPVTLTTRDYYPVKNYGSAVAPFFTNVGCWVGSFVALTLFRHDADSDGIDGLTAQQAFLGRWLLIMPVAALQGLVISIGNLLIGIQCVAPAAYVFGTMICSMTYVSVVYSLIMMFRHLGMAMSVIAIILQVPGAGGMYPVEIMPRFYQLLHPLLPFSYGVPALREAIGGFYGGHYWSYLGHTALFAVVFIVLTLLLRPHLADLNALFTRQLADSDLMNVREQEIVGANNGLIRTMRKMMNDRTWGEGLRRRAAVFEKHYPLLVRVGFHLVWIIPVLFVIATWIIGPSIGFLVAWLIAVLAIDVLLIVLEYLHQSLLRQARESEMGERELLRSLMSLMHMEGETGAAALGGAGEPDETGESGNTGEVTERITPIGATARKETC